MPSLRHSFVIDLFRDDRNLVPVLLRDSLGVSLPGYTSVEIVDADCTQAVTELRADLVLLFQQEARVVHALIVEVQLGRDERKRYSWPAYVAVERARRSCPTSLIVVTLDEGTSAWAGQAIGEGNAGGLHLVPVVIGPGQIPAVTSPEADPELALLSVLAHGEDERLAALAAVALESLKKVAPDRAKVYYEVVAATIRAAWRKGLLEKKIMDQLLEKYRHDFQSFYEEGKTDGEASSLLMVLQGRGLPLDSQAEQRVLSCKDQRLLQRWLRRAGTVQSVDELFREE